ncbi:hypothetical protein SteCoe_3143 [Stentor coeruleus]|uniref:Uncharacterized protein n=1 Tax=Stentor coeruleus TaxID=5963 RepID=A0A1R2CXT4_9CILI|nr:hypothetical protein SteCoe_3143 [Stentor coeruleus]
MLKIGTPKKSSSGIKRNSAYKKHTASTPTSNFSFGDNLFESEALKVFNQVQANRQRILTKGSDKVFYTKKTVTTTKKDPSGEAIIEKFEATAYGGFSKEGKKVGEVVQQYVNKNTGLEKCSLQRVLGDKYRRLEVKRTIDFENTEDFQENLDKDFDKDWKDYAKKIGVRKIIGFETMAKNLSPKNNF